MVIIQNKYSSIPVYKLDNYLMYVQTEKKINGNVSELETFMKPLDEMDREIKKDTRKRIKNLLIVSGPFAISIFSYAVFKKPLALQVGFTLSGCGAALLLLTDNTNSLKHVKEEQNKKTEDNIIDFYQNKDSNLVVDVEADEELEDYLRDSSFNKPMSDDEYKYKLAIYNHKIKTYSDQQYYLNKDETMKQITKELDIYSYVYKLPDSDISDNQWDALFDCIYDYCIKKGINNNYYNYMSFLNKLTLSNVLVYHKKKININNYIDSLSYLEKMDISKEDIALLEKDIMNKLSNSNIISFPKKSK